MGFKKTQSEVYAEVWDKYRTRCRRDGLIDLNQSQTRRRLTIGSHSGAEAAALYHSLTITCHRYGVNVFDYFCDIIDRCAVWPPNTPIEKSRDLLPDRWKPSQK